MPRDGHPPQSRLLTILHRLQERDREAQRRPRGPIEWAWAMPSPWTFSIAPIRALLAQEMAGSGLWVDPFAGRFSPAQVTNDLDPSANAQHHLDALDFLKMQPNASFDGAIFDGPYSPTQARKCYASFGIDKFDVSKRFWSAIKDEMARVIRPGGKAICCGWSSNGLGMSRGFTRTHLLIVAHGGEHHDTLVTVERKDRGKTRSATTKAAREGSGSTYDKPETNDPDPRSKLSEQSRGNETTPEARPKLKVVDLCSGIGGFSGGLQRAGMETVAFCESDPFCRRILAIHWPHVPIYPDIRTLTAARLHADGIFPDVLAGGFPCTDLSIAGKGKGIDGPQSGLWWQYHRLIAEIRPKLALVENVAALRARGLDCVLRSLAEIGYDAEWHCIPACAVGAPHRRDRIWILAYPSGQQFARHQREVLREPVGTDAEAGRQDIRLADPEAGPVLMNPLIFK